MGRDSEKTGKRAAGPWLDRNRWLLFLITLILFTPFAFLSVDLHHAGVMLKPAMDVADGMVIFRDSFNQYGFLTSFIQAVAVKLFGGEVLVINLLMTQSVYTLYYAPVLLLSGLGMGALTSVGLKALLPALEKLGFQRFQK